MKVVRTRVFATSRYEREAKRLLSKAEIASMESAIAADPESHPVVPGTGGVRKARWGREGTVSYTHLRWGGAA